MSRAVVEMATETHGERILQLVSNEPAGLTDFQISDRLGIHLSSVNAARNALMNAGRVAASGDKRPSGRGGMAKVWVAA